MIAMTGESAIKRTADATTSPKRLAIACTATQLAFHERNDGYSRDITERRAKKACIQQCRYDVDTFALF